jgi:hypothetical protein
VLHAYVSALRQAGTVFRLIRDLRFTDRGSSAGSLPFRRSCKLRCTTRNDDLNGLCTTLFLIEEREALTGCLAPYVVFAGVIPGGTPEDVDADLLFRDLVSPSEEGAFADVDSERKYGLELLPYTMKNGKSVLNKRRLF